MKLINTCAAGALLVTMVTGCTVRLVDFTAISTKNVRLPSEGRGPRAKGSDCKVFGIPNMKEAIDRTIEGAGPDYDMLVDGVLYQTTMPFHNCFTIEGTPINSKRAVAMGEKLPETAWAHSQPSGN